MPPNSGEVKLLVTTLAVPAMAITLDCRYMLHGTNDLALAADSLLITGDIYSYQHSNVYDYPLLDFGHDGIYDHTMYGALHCERRMRRSAGQGYYRLFADLAASRTWWNANNSGVTAPSPTTLFTLRAGLAVDF